MNGTWKPCFFSETPRAGSTPSAASLLLPAHVCCCTCSKGLHLQLLSVTSEALFRSSVDLLVAQCRFFCPKGNGCTFQLIVGYSFYLVILISVKVNGRKLQNLKRLCGLWELEKYEGRGQSFVVTYSSRCWGWLFPCPERWDFHLWNAFRVCLMSYKYI